jgi:hypothetical protein
MSEFAVVKGTRARFTRTNSCGLPIAGPNGYLVTSGFVQVTLTPVMRDAQDLEQTNAEGRVCVKDRTPPERKWYTAEIELCNVNTGLISMLTGWPQILDADDLPVGFRDQTKVETDFGVAIELWTGGKSDDDCPAPTTDTIFSSPSSGKKYGYLLTCATEFTLGNIQVNDQISTFTLSGITYALPQWGRGPWNVADIDGSGTPGRLLEPMDDDAHFALFRTPVPPPDETPGRQACPLEVASIFVDPNFYFGGPSSAPAADVAPPQPICGGVAKTVTIAGGPTGGTFSLNVGTQETTAIAYNATAAAVKAALEALSNVAVGEVSVTGGPLPGTALTVTLDPDLPALTAGDNNLTGGTTPTVTVT